MIYPYVGDFLINPVPLQLSFNFCSHKCSYCFANLNNPNRTFDVKEFQSQLKGIFTNNSLQSVLLRHKYPVVISNLVDPFATSNYGVAVPVMEMLTQLQIPVALQTRGGKGIDDVLSFLPKSVWYVSIPMLNDAIRKKVEPGAPDIQSRLDLIDKLKAKGHEVLVGINPTIEDFLPGNDSRQLIDILKAKGVHGIWVAAMHFNTKQLKVMPAKDRERIGEVIIKKGLTNSRKLQQVDFDFIDGIKKYAMCKGIWVEGMFDGERNQFFDPFFRTYEKVFPTIHNFISYCHDNKSDNAPVYYSEFESMMLPYLIPGAWNVSPYMRCMSQKVDDEIRATVGYKQTFKWLLKLFWNDRRMKRNMDRYWSFALSVNYDGKVMHPNLDTEGNLIFHFNKNEMYPDEFFINN